MDIIQKINIVFAILVIFGIYFFILTAVEQNNKAENEKRGLDILYIE